MRVVLTVPDSAPEIRGANLNCKLKFQRGMPATRSGKLGEALSMPTDTRGDAVMASVALLLERYSTRQLWGIVHDAQKSQFQADLSGFSCRLRDPRIRLQVRI